MQRVTAPGRSELHQSRSDVLGLPMLVGIVLVAVIAREVFTPHPSAIVLTICGVAAVLEIPLARWCLRNGAASLIVTHDDITFTRHGTSEKPAVTKTLQRTADSKLRFRLQSNGFVGGQPQYALKLHDDATGNELGVTGFTRSKVRQACVEQGWPFS